MRITDQNWTLPDWEKMSDSEHVERVRYWANKCKGGFSYLENLTEEQIKEISRLTRNKEAAGFWDALFFVMKSDNEREVLYNHIYRVDSDFMESFKHPYTKRRLN